MEDETRRRVASANNSQLIAMFIGGLEKYRKSLTTAAATATATAAAAKTSRPQRGLSGRGRTDRNVVGLGVKVWVIDTAQPWRPVRPCYASRILSTDKRVTIFYDTRTVGSDAGIFGVSVFFTQHMAEKRRLGLIMRELHTHARKYGPRAVPWSSPVSNNMPRMITRAEEAAECSGTREIDRGVWKNVVWLDKHGRLVVR